MIEKYSTTNINISTINFIALNDQSETNINTNGKIETLFVNLHLRKAFIRQVKVNGIALSLLIHNR